MLNLSGGIISKLRDALNGGQFRSDKELTDEELKELEVYIKRFHPPETGWLGLASLATILHCAVMWGVIALMANNDFDTVVPGDRWWRAVVILVCYVVMLYRGRWKAEREGYDTGFLYWILKFFAIVAVARFSPYVVNPGYLPADLIEWFSVPSLFFSVSFFVHLVLVAWSVTAGEHMGYRLLKLYVRPEEVFVEKGGRATGTVEFIDHSSFFRDIKGLIVSRGFLLPLMVVLLAGLSQRPDNDPIVGTMVVLTVLYIGLALAFLSILRLRYLRTTWQLAELPEPPPLRQRWPTYFFGLVLLALVGAAFLPTTSNLPTFSLNLDFLAPTGTNGLTQRRIPPLQPTQPPPQVQPPFEFPGWVLPLIMWGLALVALLVLIWVLRNAGWLGENRPRFKLPKFKLAAFTEGVANVWRGLLAWLSSLFKREKFDEVTVTGETKTRKGWLTRFQREKLPDDPREQVRFHYRQTLKRARQVGLPRRPAQTPHEYAEFLEPNLAETALSQQPQTELDNLNAAYEQARFSPHTVTPEAANTAAENSNKLKAALRQAKAKKQK